MGWSRLKTAATLLGLLQSVPAGGQPRPTLAQRLGYGPDDKVLILHVDDIGAFPEITDATRDLFAAGKARAGSVITPSAYARDAVQALPADADLGVHLALTSEWKCERWAPAAGARSVPSLIDRDGALWGNPFMTAFLDKDADVAAEFEAQIQSAFALGLRPTHLDTHMGGVFYRPSWFRAYLKAARKHRLPPMLPRWGWQMSRELGPIGPVADRVMPRLVNIFEQQGYPLIDQLFILPHPSEDLGFAARKAEYVHILKTITPGVTQIILHPAYAKGEFRDRALRESPGQMLRAHETKLFLEDPDIQDLLANSGFHFVGWREIQKIYPWDEIAATAEENEAKIQ